MLVCFVCDLLCNVVCCVVFCCVCFVLVCASVRVSVVGAFVDVDRDILGGVAWLVFTYV